MMSRQGPVSVLPRSDSFGFDMTNSRDAAGVLSMCKTEIDQNEGTLMLKLLIKLVQK